MSQSEKVAKQIADYRQLQAAYKKTFDSEDGRLVLANIEKVGHVNKTTLGDTDRQTFINEGRRQIVLHIKTMMKLDIDKIEKQLKEAGTNE